MEESDWALANDVVIIALLLAGHHVQYGTRRLTSKRNSDEPTSEPPRLVFEDSNRLLLTVSQRSEAPGAPFHFRRAGKIRRESI